MSAEQQHLELEPAPAEPFDHVERGLGHVRAGLAILGPQRPAALSIRARTARELNAAAGALKSALVQAGRLPAGAVLVDERPRSRAPAGVDEPELELAREQLTRPARYDGAELDRQQAVAIALACRVGLNLSIDDADVVREALEDYAAGNGGKRGARARDVLARIAPRLARAREAVTS